MSEKASKESHYSFVPLSSAWTGVGGVTSWYQSLGLGVSGRVLD